MDFEEVRDLEEDLYSGYRLDELGNAHDLTDHDYFRAAQAITSLRKMYESKGDGTCVEHVNSPDDPGHNAPSNDCLTCWKNRALKAEKRASDMSWELYPDRMGQ